MGDDSTHIQETASLRHLLGFLSGLTVGIFLMVTDELLGLAQSGVRTYPYPMIGTFTIWGAWNIAFAGIIGGILLGLFSIRR